MTDKIVISITKNDQEIRIETNSYLVLYFKDDKIKTVGDIELKDLTPVLLRLAAEKLSRA